MLRNTEKKTNTKMSTRLAISAFGVEEAFSHNWYSLCRVSLLQEIFQRQSMQPASMELQ
jgi:hypothetical protein